MTVKGMGGGGGGGAGRRCTSKKPWGLLEVRVWAGVMLEDGDWGSSWAWWEGIKYRREWTGGERQVGRSCRTGKRRREEELFV